MPRRSSLDRGLGLIIGGLFDALRPVFPPAVRIEATNHCNATCRFCPRESIGRELGYIDDALFEKVVSECAAGGCRVLHLHNFGEPLLDPELPRRVRLAKEHGIPWVKFFCNGALLCGETAERLLDCGLDEIKISIDGADAREFNRLRVGLDYDQVLRNAREFKAERDRRRRRRPRIVATCSLTSGRRATKRALRGTADRVAFARLHNWAGARGLLGHARIRQPCHRLWRTFTVLINGDVALCCLDHAGKEILGNCREQSIAEIWTSRRYRELRARHRRAEQEGLALCAACSHSFV